MPNPPLTPLRPILPKPKPEEEGAGFNFDTVTGAGPLQPILGDMPVQVAMTGFDADRFLSVWERMGIGMVKWDPLDILKAGKKRWQLGDPYGMVSPTAAERKATEDIRKTAAVTLEAEGVERGGGPSASSFIDQVAEAEAGHGRVVAELGRRGLRVTQHWNDLIKDTQAHLNGVLGDDWRARNTPANQAKLWGAALLTQAVNGAEYVEEDAAKQYAPLILEKMRSVYKALPADVTPEQFYQDFTDARGLGWYGSQQRSVQAYRWVRPGWDNVFKRHFEWMTGKPMPADMPAEEMQRHARGLVGTFEHWQERTEAAAKWKALGVNIPLDMVGTGKLNVTELPFFRGAILDDARLRLSEIGEGDRRLYAEGRVRDDFIRRLSEKPADVVYQTIYGLPYDEGRMRWADWASKRLDSIKDPAERYIEWSRIVKRAGTPNPDLIRRDGKPLASYAPDLYEDRQIQSRWDELFERATIQHVEWQNNASEQLIRTYDPALDDELRRRATSYRLAAEGQQRALDKAKEAPLPAAYFWALGAAQKVVEATGIEKVHEALLAPTMQEYMALHHNGDFVKGGVAGLGQPQTLGEVVTSKIRGAMPFSLGEWVDDEKILLRYSEKVRAGTASSLDQLVLTARLLFSGFTQLPGLLVEKPLDFLLFDKALRGYGRTRHAIADGLTRAGVNDALVGAAEFIMNPVDTLGPLRKMLYWAPDTARAMGVQTWLLKTRFSSMQPKQRAAFQKYVDSYLDRAGRTVYELPETKIEGIKALSSAMVAEAKHGSLSMKNAKAWGETMKKLPLALARDLNLPFAKSQVLVGAALHRARLWEQTRKALVNAERIAGEGGDFRLVDRPERFLIEMLNEKAAGRANFIDRVLDNRIGRLLSPDQRQRLKDVFAKRIDLHEMAPHLLEETPAAMRALNENRTQAINRTAELEYSIQQRIGDLADTDSRLRYHQLRAPLVNVAENQAEIQKLQERRSTQLRHKETMEQERDRITDATDVTVLGYKSALGVERTEGIEAGHKSNLPYDVKRQMIRDRITLFETRGERAWADFSQGEQLGRMWGKAKEATAADEAVLNERGQTLADARAAIIEGKLELAGRLLKSKAANVPDLMNAWRAQTDTLVDKAAALRERRLRSVEAEAASNLDLFDVGSLDEHYQEAIQALRRFGLAVEGMAGIGAEQGVGPATTYFQLLKLGAQSSGQSRAIGLSELYVDSINDFNNIVLNNLQSKYDLLGKPEQKILDDVLTGRRSMDDPRIAAEIQTMAFEEGAIRNLVLDKLLRLGKITPEQHKLYRNEGYETRVYIDNFLAQELRDAGQPIGTGNQTALPPTDLPRFEGLRAKQSTRYVRQFYKKGRRLQEKRFYIDEHGGPEGALEAAKEWGKQQIGDKILLEKELMEPVKAITDTDLGAQGLIDAQGLVRFDRLRGLFADAAKLEFFNHVALMNGMSRSSIADVPRSRAAEWTKAPLRGKEWGPLEGKYVHKNLFKMMNTWTGWSRVLEGAAEAMQKSVAEVWGPGTIAEKILYGEQRQGLPSRAMRWATEQVRQAFIIRNPGSWINNHLGGMYVAWQAGDNPASATHFKYMSELVTLLDKLSKGEIGRDHPLYQDIIEFSGQGGFSMSMGVPGKMQVSVTGRHGLTGLLKETSSRIVREQRALVKKIETVQESVAVAEALIEKGGLTKGQLTRAQQTVENGNLGIEQLKKQVLTTALTPVELQLAGRTPGGVEVQNFFLNVNKSHLSNAFGDLYGSVDAQHKWATFRYLTEVKGWSREHALAQIGSHFQNYAAVPPWVRAMRRKPIIGAFIPSFPYEAARIWSNILWQDPAKGLAILSAPFIFNLASLAASGILPSDYFEANHAESRFDQLRELFFSLNVNVGGTSHRLNVEQATGMSPFIRSTGLAKIPADKVLLPFLEDTFGAGAAVPATMAVNFASQFAFNTPWTSLGARLATGVDPFTQELVYTKEGDISSYFKMFSEVSALVAPRPVMRYLFEEKTKADNEVTSLITRHNVTQLEAFTKGILGLNVSHYTPRELFSRLLLKYSNIEQRGELLKEAWGEDDQRLHEYALQINKELDPQRRNEIVKEAAAFLKETGASKAFTGARRVDVGLSDDEATRRVLNYASRNILQVIERIPIEHLPTAAYDAELNGYSQHSPDLVRHVWTQLVDPNYLRGRNDVGELAEAWRKCTAYRNQTGDDKLRAYFDLSRAALMQRIRSILLRQRTPLLKKLLRTKAGNWQREVWEEFAKEGGLLF